MFAVSNISIIYLIVYQQILSTIYLILRKKPDKSAVIPTLQMQKLKFQNDKQFKSTQNANLW